ncbi:amino acid ABC transporter substrate-binding protein [Agrobacterium tumefaciens]|uniref:amino acid ABC transporter substrate-binding protein n=1 Tax=Agrobacterium tumefaciens TaxID=358 RepID=UPI0012B93BCD|nr:amino acid ABC transporter substrate-binding protein [Agrobacterium tumefaciens]MQB07303.1 amino acid ABC transporter substrate-binding protein [Agrobacterium tumefaciens]
MRQSFFSLVLGAVSAFAALPATAGTLDDVKARGHLQCGVSQGVAGFSMPDSQNKWNGLDVDFCRAVAAAIFDDPTKVKFTPLSAKDRFTALQSGEIDVLSRTTTWTMSRDTAMGFLFAGVTLYDGQGFMVRESLGINSAKGIDGAAVCVTTGTTTEMNLSDYFRAQGMTYQAVAIEDQNQLLQAYQEGRCDVLTTEHSLLYALRSALPNPAEHIILPEMISKEPLGPVVRQGDVQWFNTVKWVYFALLNAEEMGITQANVQESLNSGNPEIRRLLGTTGADGVGATFGSDMGLSNDWVVRIVRGVGNYGEMFERNLGPDTPLKMKRGVNALWKDGGWLYGMPVR